MSTPITCVDENSWPLQSDPAAARQEHPIAIGSGKCLPKRPERTAQTRLQQAHGGTARDEAPRPMIPPVEPVPPGEAGTTPPASGAPRPQPPGTATRIDQGELPVQSVCVFWTSPTLPIADSVASLMPDALPSCAWP